MKIVVIGDDELIGSKLVNKLRQLGHEIVAASLASGVNTITGEGLVDALKDAQVVVDVANLPSFGEKTVPEFFEASAYNILAEGTYAGVRHHVTLSIVGTDRFLDRSYFRAKMARENLIKQSGIPYTIIHSTQFYEFVGSIAQLATTGHEVHVAPAFVQPIASEDVVAAIAEISTAPAVNAIVEIAGPERLRLSEFVSRYLYLTGDTREVFTDLHANYFGAALNDQLLIPGESHRIGKIR